MALQTIQHTGTGSPPPGLNPAFTNAAAGGDSYPNTGKEVLQVKNNGGASITVTVAAQNPCQQGYTHPVAAVVAAQTTVQVGPFSFQFYTDTSGNTQVTYSTTVLAVPGAPTVAAGAAGTPNGVYKCQVTFGNASGETNGGTEVTVTVTNQQINWSNIPLGPTGTTTRKLYRTAAGGASGTEKLAQTINDNTTTVFNGDNVADGALGAAIPTSNTATCVQLAVTAP